ncbi:MAG: hypothetical protein V4532_14250, partial [Pseudomonadota bacterium]
MFASIKRLIGIGSSSEDEGAIMSTWAQSQGYAYKTVRDKEGGGYVVHAVDENWRVEWGASQ